MKPYGSEQSPYTPQGQIEGYGALARGLGRRRVVRLLVCLLVTVVAALLVGLVRTVV